MTTLELSAGCPVQPIDAEEDKLKFTRDSTPSAATKTASAVAALALLAVLAVLVAPAVGAVHGKDAAGRFVLHRIRKDFPQAKHVFVNCPRDNFAPPAEVHGFQHPAVACEFRFVTGRRVVKGQAEAGELGGPSHRPFFMEDFETGRPAPLAWRRCRMAPVFQERRMKVVVFGESCVGAEPLVEDLAIRAGEDESHHLPGRLSVGEEEGLEDGFVTRRYHCRDHSHRGTPGSRPHIHEEARCRTRFGDRIDFSADQYH